MRVDAVHVRGARAELFLVEKTAPAGHAVARSGGDNAQDGVEVVAVNPIVIDEACADSATPVRKMALKAMLKINAAALPQCVFIGGEGDFAKIDGDVEDLRGLLRL